MDSKGLKERIVSGVIVWLLVFFFIRPLLSFTWKVVLAVGGYLHKGYVDRVYASAALVVSDRYGFTMVGALFIGILLAFMYMKLNAVEPFSPIFLTRAFKVLWWLMTVFSVLMLFVQFAISSGTMVITASFTQRLTVLAPAISETELKTLKAKWASMQGKADYDALVVAMDKRATQLSITLPPVLNP